MNAQDLKNSILQLAIQGKLVEQREEEGTARELLVQIKAEKEQLIKEKKIKKEQPLQEITENEIPFDIPENWEWVRLIDLAYLNSGGQYEETATGVFYIKVADMNLVGNEHEITTSSRKAKVNANALIPTGSIIFPKRGGAIATNKKRLVLQTEICVDSNTMSMTVINKGCLRYLYLWFVGLDLGKLSTGTSIPQINNKDLYPLLIPLPPLEEQKRIVAKVEELMPYVEKYGEAHSKLEVFNKKFPEDMQKSILQYAIQGKLVEQRDEEGTAEALYQQIQEEKVKLIKEGKIKMGKPLPAITEDELQFDIPDSWKWVRLGDISLNIGDIDHKMPPTVEDGYPYISPLNFTINSIDFDGAKKIGQNDFEHLSKKIKPERNDIIFPRYGTIGVIRMVDTDREFLVSYSCCTIKNLEKYIYPKYIFHTLKSGMIKKEINRYINKTTQPNIGLESIKKFLIPIPPLKEQKRIVAKIEEMMPYCQQLVGATL
ncbi:restriction endonuclease subunit S [Paenibacillus odorifer]|uniref:restriction endonuclease subunit S n=1 Tax=Paenibacillus odorifer TaxID=189426 RepID=UPI000BA0ECA6|nr:restriction endonuclease subunit S [Paenibacillus odorifer]OZQ73872.1 hypothetical protein CA596_18350 [Paenibacillus odorifer]